MAGNKSISTSAFKDTIKMTLTTNGELGVGVIDPTYRITSAGVVQARSVLNKTIGGQVLIVGTSVWNGDVHLLTGHCNGTNVGFIQVTNGDPTFTGTNIVNSTYNLSLQPGGGNVGIGIQNQFVFSGAQRMMLSGFPAYPATTWGTSVGAYSVRLAVAGDIHCTGITVLSDKRTKSNIVTLGDTLDKIMKLNPTSFNKNEMPELVSLGFIAQEVVDIFPETIRIFIDEELEGGRMTIDYNSFFAILTKGMQEQQDIINSQADTINDLQKQLNDIKDLLTKNNIK
jgi:hypothetical protein